MERSQGATAHHNESVRMGKTERDRNGVRVHPARRVVSRGDGSIGPQITRSDVLKDVARDFGVSEDALRSRSTSTAVSFARDELCRRLRELGFTYPEIGEFLGGRTHSAVIVAVRRAEARVVSSS